MSHKDDIHNQLAACVELATLKHARHLPKQLLESLSGPIAEAQSRIDGLLRHLVNRGIGDVVAPDGANKTPGKITRLFINSCDVICVELTCTARVPRQRKAKTFTANFSIYRLKDMLLIESSLPEDVVRQLFQSISEEEITNVISRVMGVHPEAGAAAENCEEQLRGVGCISGDTKMKPQFATYSLGAIRKLFEQEIKEV